MLSVNNYKYKSWEQVYSGEYIDIGDIPVITDWRDTFCELREHGMFKEINKVLNDEVKAGYEIYPYPDLLFNAFNSLYMKNTKVLILGQDPYINSESHNGIRVPQAMGYSFSVPIGITTPPSLQNIYKNQAHYKVIPSYQPHGNLESWVRQGCLLMNASLTVQQSVSNSHKSFWQIITNKLIKKIAKENPELIIVTWGRDAIDKLKLIDFNETGTNYRVIRASHPSGYSFNTPCGQYPAFSQTDHFNEINNYLVESSQKPIVWQLF